MSPSVNITRRKRQGGYRYVVRYRLSGSDDPLHGGSFKTRADAEARARWISGEIAAMRVPNIRALGEVAGSLTVTAAVREWLAGRHKLAEGSRDNYRPAIARIDAHWSGVRVAEVTPKMVSEWVGAMIEDETGRTVIDRCMAALRQTLDLHRDPNPARHRSVELPKAEQVEANPPPFAHWQLILDGVTHRFRLPLRMLEGTGLRVGELQALRWGDIDFTEGRLFVRGGKTRAARRWVPVPAGLIHDLDGLVPREDREPEGQVFPGLIGGSLRMAMRRVSRSTGTPLYSPHDLRHRYITLLIRRGMDPAAVASLAGHTRKSMTLDVYSHLLLDEEMP